MRAKRRSESIITYTLIMRELWTFWTRERALKTVIAQAGEQLAECDTQVLPQYRQMLCIPALRATQSKSIFIGDIATAAAFSFQNTDTDRWCSHSVNARGPRRRAARQRPVVSVVSVVSAVSVPVVPVVRTVPAVLISHTGQSQCKMVMTRRHLN